MRPSRFRMVLIGALLALALPFFALLRPSTARACTCAPPPSEAESYARAPAVFTGTVSKIEFVPDNEHQLRILFAVTSAEKGQVAGDVEIRTASDGGACGATLYPGVTYRLFAGRNREGLLEIHMCGLQQALSPLPNPLPLLPRRPVSQAPNAPYTGIPSGGIAVLIGLTFVGLVLMLRREGR